MCGHTGSCCIHCFHVLAMGLWGTLSRHFTCSAVNNKVYIKFCILIPVPCIFYFSFTVTNKKVKVKVTLVQALKLCTGRTAHGGSRGIVLPFHDHGTRRGGGLASRPGHSLPLRKTHCTGGWVGPRAGLDRCGKSRLHQDLIPIPSNT